MSNTVVKDCTPAPRPGDNALVIVVGEDGSLSVDPETLNNLINTEVNIVRMSGSDPENNTVNATLDTFYDTNANTSYTMASQASGINILTELSVDVSELTRMCRNVQMDHCYTPLTSPSQKAAGPSGTTSDGLPGMQNLNKSTEDLVAVLSENDPIVPPSKPPPRILNPTIPTIAVQISKSNSSTEKIHILNSNASSSVPKITNQTVNQTLVQTINKNMANLSSMAKKPLKIVAVQKPVGGIRMVSSPISSNKPSLAVREPKPEEIVEKEPDEGVLSTALNDLKENANDEELSDISSDSDFDEEDDSADSDFDAGRQKVPSKPKYKTFGSKRSSKTSGTRFKKDRTIPKSIANRIGSKTNKNITSKGDFQRRTPMKVIKTKLPKPQKLSPVVAEKEEVSPVSALQSVSDGMLLEQSKQDTKKNIKKKVIKVVPEVFDDGIALFSTPDVIRRVSIGGKSVGDMPDSPTKLEGRLVRTPSTEQKIDNLFELKTELNPPTDKIKSVNEVSTPQIVDNKIPIEKENIGSLEDRSTKISLNSDLKQLSGVDTSCLDTTDASLANMNLDNAHLDLDLNSDELLPEDLLFQVAKLVENADIQKVIDTNLTLVDQNLESVLSKHHDNNLLTTDTPGISAPKELEKPEVRELSVNIEQLQFQNIPSKLPTLQNTNMSEHKTYLQSPSGVITKNNTNKPIQIVRADGRVITIPPIEKPATRSSKKRQVGDDVSAPPATITASLPPPVVKQILPATGSVPPTKLFPLVQKQNIIENERRDSTEVMVPEKEALPHGDNSEDSDSDESWKSEDDPDRLWCICKQPHNNRFMICCDTCEEWFHGQCVGVSKALGRQMEQQGKEWQCPNCQKVKKNALQQALNEAQADMPLSPPVENTTIEEKAGPRCIVCKGPSRSESVYCSEKCIVQHSNTVERVIVFERATGRCLSGNNAPTVANLKQWLKQHPGFEVVSSGNKTLTQSKLQLLKSGKLTLQHPPKPVVKPPTAPKQVHILNHVADSNNKPAANHKAISQQSFYGKPNSQTGTAKAPPPFIIKAQSATKTAGPGTPQIKTAKLIQPHTIVIKQPQQKAKTSITSISHPVSKVASQQEPTTPKTKQPTPTANKSTPPQKQTPTPQKVVRQKSISSSNTPESEKHTTTPHKGPEQLRENVRKTLAEHFTLRLKEQNDIKMKDDEVKALSTEIEAELYSLFNKDTGAKYRNRYRSLVFNIKDTKNASLWKRICQKTVSPKELVRLSPEELASQELAQWREREAKHQLDMIKKSELDLLSCVRTYVLKSHKGEEVIEKRAAVDSTIVADLDNTLNEEATADSTSERPRSQTSSTRETSRSKTSSDEKDRHRRDSNSSRHKSKHDDKIRDKSSRKHREGSRDRKKRSRSKERHRDGSKEHRNSEGKRRHRSRSGSRHKSTEENTRRHKDRHDRNKHKSSTTHKHRHKDSESDSASSSTIKVYDRSSSKEGNKSDGTDLLTIGLDKKSKEILESLVDNKVVPPLDDRMLKLVEEPPLPTTTNDSESDHEPSSTVTIATPPHNPEHDSDKGQVPLSAELLSDTSPIDENSDANSECNDKKTSCLTKHLPPTPVTSADGPCVWKGIINMVDVAKFRITAQEVSGDCAGLATELPTGLDIVGRISPDTVWEYLGKMRRSTAKFISILRLSAENVEEQAAYQSLYTYLSSRKRFGVVKTANTSIKDFYIMPQASYNPLPQVLLPLNGPGFEESRPNLLLGILVSSKRKRSHIFVETTTPSLPKRTKESPPRSYTPPPSGNTGKDPRASRHNLVSSIAMPPLPSVTPTPPPELPKPEPPPVADDMDEPYSPGDSDDALPSIAVNIISKPKPVQKTESVIKETVEPAARDTKPISSDLSILEPFKTSNFSTIPGLEPTIPTSEIGLTNTLGVSSLLSTSLATSLAASLDVSSLLSVSSNLSAELNSTDLDALQRNIDEINKKIERERQEIDSISQGIVQKEELGSSCLANIALPSNLQQILDSIKTTKKVDSPSVELDEQTDEYLPISVASSGKIASYTPSTSVQHRNESDRSSESDLPTIPLLLPKLNTRTSNESATKSSCLSELTIPLNLPLPKRTLTHSPLISSPGKKRTAIDFVDVTEAKKKHIEPVEKKSNELPSIPLNFLIKKAAIKKSSDIDTRKNVTQFRDVKEESSDVSPSTKPSSVLSSLSTEELIRKANEMLAVQDEDKDEDEDEELDEEDEPYDPETSQPMKLTPKVASIKQAPVLYPNTSIPPPNMRFKPTIEQPPVPGLEDYE